MTKLLYLPHRTRLDFGVLLTSSILFSIPSQIFVDALVVLHNFYRMFSLGEIQEIYNLPRFIKTAVVSIILRICQRELEEIALCGMIRAKPKQTLFITDLHSLFAPTFRGADGYNHLKAIKVYLEMNLEIPTSGVDLLPNTDNLPDRDVFTELEMEIINCLVGS